MSDNKDSKKKGQQIKQTTQKQESKKKEIQKDVQVLKLLEEDQDDFEQFQEDAYDNVNVPPKIDAKQWREDWDDEDINDDFTTQLKKQLQV